MHKGTFTCKFVYRNKCICFSYYVVSNIHSIVLTHMYMYMYVYIWPADTNISNEHNSHVRVCVYVYESVTYVGPCAVWMTSTNVSHSSSSSSSTRAPAQCGSRTRSDTPSNEPWLSRLTVMMSLSAFSSNEHWNNTIHTKIQSSWLYRNGSGIFVCTDLTVHSYRKYK